MLYAKNSRYCTHMHEELIVKEGKIDVNMKEKIEISSEEVLDEVAE